MSEVPQPPIDNDYTDIVERAQRGEIDTIIRFRGDHYFLSNMYPLYPPRNGVESPDGIVVPAVEIGYKADKHVGPARLAVLAAVDGMDAHVLSKDLIRAGEPVAKGWATSKLDVMRWYVLQKFGRNPELAEQLISTENRLLVEGNNWGDTFWGVSKVKGGKWSGTNHLGKLHMEIRSMVQGGADLDEAAQQTLNSSPYLLQIRQDFAAE